MPSTFLTVIFLGFDRVLPLILLNIEFAIIVTSPYFTWIHFARNFLTWSPVLLQSLDLIGIDWTKTSWVFFPKGEKRINDFCITCFSSSKIPFLTPPSTNVYWMWNFLAAQDENFLIGSIRLKTRPVLCFCYIMFLFRVNLHSAIA